MANMTSTNIYCIYYATGCVLSALHVLTHLIFIAAVGSQYSKYPHLQIRKPTKGHTTQAD